MLSTLWQTEMERQKLRLETDLMSRMMGVILTCALYSLYLPVRFVFGLYLIVILSEVVNAALFNQLCKRPRYVDLIYVALMLNIWAGMCAFCFLGTLVWGLSDPLVKVSGVLSLVGALISVSTSRAVHLPFGIVSGIPPSVALIWIAARGWSNDDGFGNSAFATVAVIGLIGYFTSALVQNHVTQTRLAQALSRASAASRAKSRFLSEMNHEMRTPLNTILGLSQTLPDVTSHQELSDRAAKIESAGRNLQMLIEDVLDLAAAEEGEIAFRPVTTVIRQEIHAIARVLSGSYATEGKAVTVHIAEEVSELGRLDPLLLRKCLLKLASMLPTPPGPGKSHPVTLSCHSGLLAGSTLLIKLSAETPLQDIEDRRSKDADPDKYRHLVAELADRLATAMGATLRLTDSATGDLASAEIALSYTAVPDLPTPTTRPSARRLLALIVDDISTNRFVISQLLKMLSIDAVEAESGAVALAALDQQHFDLVLLDMNMPTMNGEQTFRTIRGSPHPWAAVPIIALTADAQPEQREKYLSFGIDGYVAKPVDSRLLWAEIAACVPSISSTGD